MCTIMLFKAVISTYNLIYGMYNAIGDRTMLTEPGNSCFLWVDSMGTCISTAVYCRNKHIANIDVVDLPFER